MFKHMMVFAAVVGLVFAMAPAAQASLLYSDPGGFTAPAGLNEGDFYHLVFVSSGTLAATSTDIGDYNDLVQGEMDTAGKGITVDVEWFAIGSTAATHARNNAPVFGNVYRLDGVVQVAAGVDGLWTGSLLAAIDVVANNTWTGSLTTGYASVDRTLGGPGTNAVYGGAAFSDGRWINAGDNSRSPAFHFYGLSEKLEVVPEPATLALLGLGGLGLLVRRKR